MSTIEPTNPLHVAIILDGNGRWAAARGLPRVVGHRAGAVAVRRTLEAAPELGVTTLTLYAFSADNWQRPRNEVAALMELLEIRLRRETRHAVERGLRVSVIGRRDRVPASVARAIEQIETATATADRFLLRIAIDYSARAAILEAARRARPEDLADPAAFTRCLNLAMHSPADVAPVDLLIRTSGEKRLSDFLLWECAYAELVFIDREWPDFDANALAEAIDEYRRRDRRYGRILEQASG